MPWVIDRFEEGFAVLEDTDSLESLDLPRSQLPTAAQEGHTLKMEDGCYVIDYEDTEARRKRIQEKFSRLKFKK